MNKYSILEELRQEWDSRFATRACSIYPIEWQEDIVARSYANVSMVFEAVAGGWPFIFSDKPLEYRVVIHDIHPDGATDMVILTESEFNKWAHMHSFYYQLPQFEDGMVYEYEGAYKSYKITAFQRA